MSYKKKTYIIPHILIIEADPDDLIMVSRTFGEGHDAQNGDDEVGNSKDNSLSSDWDCWDDQSWDSESENDS